MVACSIVRVFGQHKDDKKKIENALKAANLMPSDKKVSSAYLPPPNPQSPRPLHPHTYSPNRGLSHSQVSGGRGRAGACFSSAQKLAASLRAACGNCCSPVCVCFVVRLCYDAHVLYRCFVCLMVGAVKNCSIVCGSN